LPICLICGAILRRELVAVRRLDELPEEGRGEAEILRSLGTRSALAVPLVVEGELLGACIVTTEREERDWPDATVAELWVLGGLMASATSRCRAERAPGDRERYAFRGRSLRLAARFRRRFSTPTRAEVVGTRG
jgi:GAF domain-containing protein